MLRPFVSVSTLGEQYDRSDADDSEDRYRFVSDDPLGKGKVYEVIVFEFREGADNPVAEVRYYTFDPERRLFVAFEHFTSQGLFVPGSSVDYLVGKSSLQAYDRIAEAIKSASRSLRG